MFSTPWTSEIVVKNLERFRYRRKSVRLFVHHYFFGIFGIFDTYIQMYIRLREIRAIYIIENLILLLYKLFEMNKESKVCFVLSMS